MAKFQLLESCSSAARLDAARDFVGSFPPGTEILLLGSSREAVDDFAALGSWPDGFEAGVLHRRDEQVLQDAHEVAFVGAMAVQPGRGDRDRHDDEALASF